jgi:hypothetical protein
MYDLLARELVGSTVVWGLDVDENKAALPATTNAALTVVSKSLETVAPTE